MPPGGAYVRWPSVQPVTLELSDPASLVRHVISVSAVGVALSLPSVVNATGISASIVAAMIALHLVWYVSVLILHRRSVEMTPLRFHAALAGSIVVNTLVCVGFPALGADPETPLWMIPVMYACFNGAIQELEPSVGVLLIHVGVPVLAIPVELARGANPDWSIAAPLLCSAASAVGYNHLAQVGGNWRSSRREREASLATLRASLEDDDRARLARDLHDSMGSSLVVVGLFGDLIERHVERPDELRAIAAMVRDASHEGSVELAALVGGIMPASADLDAVAATLVEHARRAASSSGTSIDVRVVRGGEAQLVGVERLTLVRVVQESLHNALEHGEVHRIDVALEADADTVTVAISDDGIGFVPADAALGTGVSGMRARVEELGGEFTLAATPGAGTRVCVSLPRSRQKAP